MSKSETWARKNLPYSIRLRNTVRMRGKEKHPSDYALVTNTLYNLYGPPMIRLERSEYSPTGLYWKRNSEGRWAQIRNQFLFKNLTDLMLIKLYIPEDYEITKQVI